MALALILAAGRGERLGSDGPKALVPLAGRPLLSWSVDLLLGLPEIERIVVALPAGVQAPAGVIGVRGGEVRSQSVALALAGTGVGAGVAAGADVGAGGPDGLGTGRVGRSDASGELGLTGVDPRQLVLVHDAARPLVSAGLVRATLAALEGDERLDGAIAAAPVSDTIKRVDDAGDGVVVETLERSALWAVQTPQVFRRGTLERALDVPADILSRATDDAWLVERIGGRVGVVPADTANLKITTAVDLELAELLVSRARGRKW